MILLQLPLDYVVSVAFVSDSAIEALCLLGSVVLTVILLQYSFAEECHCTSASFLVQARIYQAGNSNVSILSGTVAGRNQGRPLKASRASSA